MEYTVKELADLAGVTGRTIRYYDQIGILKPARISESGYRIYGPREVDLLQQILFYRELGVELEEIKAIVTDPKFDRIKALHQHREKLLNKRSELDLLIANVERTIAAHERGVTMSDREKFAGFKQRLIAENERKYGKEALERWGAEAVERSNQAFLNMTEAEYAEFTKLGEELIETLKQAFASRDPAGETAQKAAEMHRKWLTFTWGTYNKEAHAGAVQLYVDDPRFTEYYDQHQPGLAKFLRDAVLVYISRL